MKIAILTLLIAAGAAASDLTVTANLPEESTGTMHYAVKVTVALGEATPLVLEGPMLPIPGPHFRLGDSRFLLLGWSSGGSGMQTMHVLLIRVRRGAVVLDRELTVMTDRSSAGLLVRVGTQSARIGLPKPPADFVSNPDEWFLNLGGESLDFQHMRKLRFVTVQPQKGDLFYTASSPPSPMPKRVAWIDVTANGFVFSAAARTRS